MSDIWARLEARRQAPPPRVKEGGLLRQVTEKAVVVETPPTIETSEWQDMPEFVQVSEKPYSTIIVRCRDASDLAELASLLQQKLTPKTKSIWYPQLIRGINGKKRWVDES